MCLADTFKNGTIDHEAVIFASCDTGIANYNIKTGEWNLIPPGVKHKTSNHAPGPSRAPSTAAGRRSIHTV